MAELYTVLEVVDNLYVNYSVWLAAYIIIISIIICDSDGAKHAEADVVLSEVTLNYKEKAKAIDTIYTLMAVFQLRLHNNIITSERFYIWYWD